MNTETFNRFFTTNSADPDLVLFGFFALIMGYVAYRIIKNLMS